MTRPLLRGDNEPRVPGAAAVAGMPARVGGLLDELESEQGRVAEMMAKAIGAGVSEYGSLQEPGTAAALREHCGEHLRTFVRLIRGGRRPTDADLEFVRTAAGLEVRRGVSLEGLLHAYRVGQRVSWEWGVRQAGETSAGREAALVFSARSIEYHDLVSTSAANAYVTEQQQLVAEEDRARQELMKDLIAGRLPLGPSSQVVAASRGFGAGSPYVVAVAVVEEGSPRTGADALRFAGETVGHSLDQGGNTALIVVRRDELTALVCTDQDLQVRDQVGRAIEALQKMHAVALIAGVSAACRGFEEIPIGYEEASRAMRRARPGTVLAAKELPLLECLMDAAGEMARRIVPAGISRFLEEDARQRGILVATLRAYLEADLNVGRTAKRLFVHPNTVQYRLRRISMITGMSMRKFRDLVEILIAIEIAGANGSRK